jgi:hypothetical protein
MVFCRAQKTFMLLDQRVMIAQHDRVGVRGTGGINGKWCHMDGHGVAYQGRCVMKQLLGGDHDAVANGGFFQS